MINSILFYFLFFSKSEKQPDPKCPHCHKKLKGYSEPSNSSTFDILKVLTIVGLLMIQITGAVFGGSDGSFGNYSNKECGEWFSKRLYYIIPTYQVSCRTVMWLRNKSDYMEKIQ